MSWYFFAKTNFRHGINENFILKYIFIILSESLNISEQSDVLEYLDIKCIFFFQSLECKIFALQKV